MRVQKSSTGKAGLPVFVEPLTDFFKKWDSLRDFNNLTLIHDDKPVSIDRTGRTSAKTGVKRTIKRKLK